MSYLHVSVRDARGASGDLSDSFGRGHYQRGYRCGDQAGRAQFEGARVTGVRSNINPMTNGPPAIPIVPASPIRPEIEPKRLRPKDSTSATGITAVVTPAVRP